MRRKTYALVFAAIALSGLAVWVVSTPAVAGPLFGDAAYRAAYSFPLWAAFGLPLLALPPLAGGLLLPKGFALWGVAAVVPYVPGSIWLATRPEPEMVFRTGDPGARQILGLAFVYLSTFFLLAVACTVSAAVGAGVRLLFWRLRGEPVAERLGLSSGPRG